MATAKQKNSISLGLKTLVCQEAELRGPADIIIGSGTILHPRCKIVAEAGPVIIGQNNIIEENVIIINKNSAPLIIGDENVFEVACYFEGCKVGNRNVIEARAQVLGTTSIGNNCVIGAVCTTEINEDITDQTVLYGYNHNRRMYKNPNTTQAALHVRHLEYLRDVLPKYNHMRPPTTS